MQSPIVPEICYRDPSAMVDWLCHVFGLGRHRVMTNEAGHVYHAELTLGSGMVLISPAEDAGGDSPDPGGTGHPALSVYIVAEDVDGACRRAREAGAEILREPVDQDYGGRDFTCRDPEGIVWSVGSYDPWTAPLNVGGCFRLGRQEATGACPGRVG